MASGRPTRPASSNHDLYRDVMVRASYPLRPGAARGRLRFIRVEALSTDAAEAELALQRLEPSMRAAGVLGLDAEVSGLKYFAVLRGCSRAS